MIIFTSLTQEKHWKWAMARTHVVPSVAARGIVALDKDGEPCAAVIFDNWTQTAVQGHIVIENPIVIRRGFLHEIACYVFGTCGKIILIGVTPSDNLESLRFNRKIGFREVYRIKDGFDYGVDSVIQEMHKAECRWFAEPREQGVA